MASSAHILSKVSEIRNRIAEGDLRGAIKETIFICEGSDRELYDDAIVASFQFHFLSKEGEIPTDEITFWKRNTQICLSILRILTELEELPLPP